jgi:hypothetical protein
VRMAATQFGQGLRALFWVVLERKFFKCNAPQFDWSHHEAQK